MKLFIDIETRRIPADDPRLQKLVADAAKDLKAPANYGKEAADKWMAGKLADLQLEVQNKTSFDPGFGTIAVIGMAVEDQMVQSFANPDEYTLLQDFCGTLYPYRDGHPTFVGHNVMWDLRFILRRCIVLGIVPPRFLIDAARGKHWGPGVIDTMLLWDDSDRSKYVKLDRLCTILGIPSPKDGFSGADVSPALEAGELAKVVLYNGGDVRAVREVFNRLMFVPVKP